MFSRLIIATIVALLSTPAMAKWSFNYMPISTHHGTNKNYNEVHHGLGVSLSGEDTHYGIMAYNNSYDNFSVSVNMGNHLDCWGATCAYGLALVTGYEDYTILPAPYIGIKMGRVSFIHIPLTVTALQLTLLEW